MHGQFTEILQRISDGQANAVDDLIPLVYEQMKLIAARAIKTESGNHTDPTELVHEAYIRLIGNEQLAWESRSHFFGACATVIRRILVDQARFRKSKKRGGDVQQIELKTEVLISERSIDLVEFDDALSQLAQLSPRQARLVELRFFAGFSESEAAELLGVSKRTVAGDWAMARAWLKTQLG